MKKNRLNVKFTTMVLVSLTVALVSVSCKKDAPNLVSSKGLDDFNQVNLVSNNPSYNAGRVDPLLQDAWGMAFSPTGNIWLSANVTGYSTVYDKEGSEILSPVAIPSPASNNGGTITGIVFSGAANFKLPNSLPSIFAFAGQDGVISGWNKGNPKNAIKMVDNSGTASYFGLALANSKSANYLYAANFKAGTIDVFDSTWRKVNMQFTDPNLPALYSPFNIQKIDDNLYVMYAKVGPDGNEVHAAGLGIIDVFNSDGSFVKRFASNGQLNSPWGIAKAPSSFFGPDSTNFSNTILVGNFGDGHINAYSANGAYTGQLKSKGNPLVIDGLWAISFAPVTATTIDPNRLYFEAGPYQEKDGLFGYIKK